MTWHTFCRWWWADRKHGVDNIGSKFLRQRCMDFGSKRGVRDIDERGAVKADRSPEGLQELRPTRYEPISVLKYENVPPKLPSSPDRNLPR